METVTVLKFGGEIIVSKYMETTNVSKFEETISELDQSAPIRQDLINVLVKLKLFGKNIS